VFSAIFLHFEKVPDVTVLSFAKYIVAVCFLCASFIFSSLPFPELLVGMAFQHPVVKPFEFSLKVDDLACG